MSVRLVWTRRALDDRKAIFAYIQRNNPQAALDLDHHLVSSARQLVDMPDIGRKGQLHGTREFVAHRHYILVYEVRGNVLRVQRNPSLR